MNAYIKEMRIHHYIKNVLVLIPLLFSGQFFDWARLHDGIIGVIAFCLLSSAIYFINDLADIESDRSHPVKKNRPIASGSIPLKAAYAVTVALIVAAFLVNFLIFDIQATLMFIVYLALNIAYSFGLKNYPLIDLVVLVTGFVLRIAYGSIITGIEISNWLYLTTFTIAFYFGMGKRRNELMKIVGGPELTRPVLRYYSAEFLDKNMYMCLALANVFYALWCMDSTTISLYGNNIIFTVPIVILITMRYSMDIECNNYGDPVDTVLHDYPLFALCSVFFLTLFLLLYS